MIFKKIILILIVALLCKCELPTENISYIQSPVVFGYIDAGFNRIDTLYLYWTSSLTTSHFENNYIDNASVNLSSGNQNIELNHIGNGKYLPDNLYPNPPIQPNSTWNLEINFSYNDKEYNLQSSTTVPNTITPDVMISDIQWQCDGEDVVFNEEDFNLYQNQNNVDLIQSWLNDPSDISFLENNINIDTFRYSTRDCYTSSFASTPFFTLDIDSENQNDTIISRYLTLSLETDKDMNQDGFNIPYEAAIFDTLFDANAFKGPMQYTEIDYDAYQGIDLQNIPYEWGWHREPVNRINLEGDQIEFSWLFFNYFGKHITIIQPMGKEYEAYFEGDPDQFNFPYILRQGNITSVNGEDSYGLFYSTNSKYFLFDVLEPIESD